MTKLITRSDKVAFMNVGTPETPMFKRMQYFTELSPSKNPKEYSRQYVDEAFEQTDVVGYAPSISFGFDQYLPDPVIDKIVSIFDQEKTGSDTLVDILVVDFSGETPYKASLRTWAVIPDSEGDGNDAYTYSGTFKAKSTAVYGTADYDADEMIAVFVQD